jgi:hypothetical protein
MKNVKNNLTDIYIFNYRRIKMTHCDIFIKCTKPNYKKECEFSESDEHQSSMCKFAKRHSMLGPTYNDIFSCTNEKAKMEYLGEIIWNLPIPTLADKKVNKLKSF